MAAALYEIAMNSDSLIKLYSFTRKVVMFLKLSMTDNDVNNE